MSKADEYFKLVTDYDEFKKIDYNGLIDQISTYSSVVQNFKYPQDAATTVHNDFINSRDAIILENLKKLEKSFQEEIRKYEVEFIQNSYKYYDDEVKHDNFQDIQEYYNSIHMTSDVKEIIEGKIGAMTTWKAPGLEISPGINHFTNVLVALDPLYIVDKHRKALKKTESIFNPEYRRRLRTYQMLGDGNFDNLPQGQFGLIFSFGFFERLPLDVIKLYLKGFHDLLRPGGRVLLTYNNCLLKSSLDMTIFRYYRLFNTEHYMKPLVYGHGFDDIVTEDISANISTIEFKKPGEFSSQRHGQTLGKIQKIY